jgi:hypothetical protein
MYDRPDFWRLFNPLHRIMWSWRRRRPVGAEFWAKTAWTKEYLLH